MVVDKRYLWLLNPLMDNIESLRCLFQMHAMIIVIYVKCCIIWGTIYVIKKFKIKDLCRVQIPWHTAKEPTFAVCQAQVAHGKRPPPRQLRSHAKKFAVGQSGHTAKTLPCARYIAHGKGALCRRLFAVCGTRQTFCRELLWLCRAHDKRVVSRSEPS